MAKSNPPRHWQNIIWREWRNCEDEDYAKYLFDLIANKPAGWGAIVIMTLLGILFGVIIGALAGLATTNWVVLNQVKMWNLKWPILLSLAWKVGAISGVGGLFIGAVLGRLVPWRSWLAWLTPSMHNYEKPLTFGFFLIIVVAFGVLIGLVGGIGTQLTLEEIPLSCWVILLFLALGFMGSLNDIGDDIGCETLLVLVLAFVLGFGLRFGLTIWLISILVSGLVFGLLFGPYLGSGLGLSSGLTFGSSFGLFSGIGIGLSCSLVTLVSGLGVILGSGLVALWSNLDKQNRYIYEYRSWWFWWRRRPYAIELETTLHQIKVRPAMQAVWAEPLCRLEEAQRQLGPPNALIATLRNKNWVEHFVARHALVALGGTAVKDLQPMAQDADKPLRRIALWLLESIGQETTIRLKESSPHLLCPYCLVRCHVQRVSLSWQHTVTFYGCRACQQSRKFWRWPGKVVAKLDVGMTEDLIQQDLELRINWLRRKTLFDFDRVEIRQATDKQVQEFIIQVGNDTDVIRKPHYKEMICIVTSNCKLMENTVRILKDTFGQVTVMV